MHGITRKLLARLVLASGVALGLAPAADASGDRHGGQTTHWRGLDLSEAQRDQVFRIHHEQAPAIHEQMKQARRAREDLHKLSIAGNFDEAKVRDAANAQAKAMAELAVLRAQTTNRIRGVLTPKQRSRLEQMPERHRGPGLR